MTTSTTSLSPPKDAPMPELPWVQYWGLAGKSGEGTLEEVVERTRVPMQAVLRVLRGWRRNPVNGWYFMSEVEWPQDDGYPVGSSWKGRRVPSCFHNGSPGRISRPLAVSDRETALDRARTGDIDELYTLTNGDNPDISIETWLSTVQEHFPRFPYHPILYTALDVYLQRTPHHTIIHGVQEYHALLRYIDLFIKCWLSFNMRPTEALDFHSFNAEASQVGIDFGSAAQQSFDQIDHESRGTVTLPEICYWFATNKNLCHI